MVRRVRGFADFAAAANGISDPAGLEIAYREAAKQQGFENVVMASVSNGRLCDVHWQELPEGYVSYYVDRRFDKVDPILARSYVSMVPFFWSDLTPGRHFSKEEAAFLNECEDIGVHTGLTIPVHGPGSRLFLFSLSMRERETEPRHLFSELCQMTYHTFSQLIGANADFLAGSPAQMESPVHLSEREVECLQWAKHGKSNPDIGEILGVSSKTVEFHLSNAMTKLGANNRMMAVVIALQKGIIQL